MIDVEKWEEIRRAYYVQGKSLRQIASETGHAWRTIRRMVDSAEPMRYRQQRVREAPKLGAYQEQIEVLLAESEQMPRKQRYTASKIYELLRGMGFAGAESTVRHYVAKVRKHERRPRLYLPLSFEAGRDGQVDWGEGQVVMAGQRCTVQLFVMRLNYSRRLFVMAFPGQKQECFFAGHVAAFHYFGGIAQRLTYDNLTTAVQKILKGKNRQEQEQFIALRGHYLFESHFCTPGEAHEKGGVENSIGYVQRQFLTPLPAVDSFAELNAYLLTRCVREEERQVKGQPATIGAMGQEEQAYLRALPGRDFDCCRSVEATLTPYSQVVLETNRYSLPVKRATAQLVAKLYPFEVKIYSGSEQELLAVHARCYGREQDVFDPLHYLPLLAQRPGAFEYAKPMRQWRAQWPPVYEELLAYLQRQWPEGRGVREFIAILQLHQQYAGDLIEQAITQALAYHCAHADGVLLCLNQLLQPALATSSLDLGERPHLQAIGAQQVDLGQYNVLLGRAA
jgi:transposase